MHKLTQPIYRLMLICVNNQSIEWPPKTSNREKLVTLITIPEATGDFDSGIKILHKLDSCICSEKVPCVTMVEIKGLWNQGWKYYLIWHWSNNPYSVPERLAEIGIYGKYWNMQVMQQFFFFFFFKELLKFRSWNGVLKTLLFWQN